MNNVKTWWFKTIAIYLADGALSQQLGLGSVGWFFWSWLGSLMSLWLASPPIKYCFIHIPGGCLVVGGCLHRVPSHLLQLAQVSSPRGGQGSRRMSRHMQGLFCLGSKLAPCHFCCLLVRASTRPALIQGERIEDTWKVIVQRYMARRRVENCGQFCKHLPITLPLYCLFS